MHNHSNNDIQIDVEPLQFQQIPNWVFESAISANAIKLYLVLRKNGDNKRGTSFYSRKKLAEQLGASANTMDRAKAELVEIGAICLINRKNDKGDWTSNLYHVHTNQLKECKYLYPKMGTPIPTDGDTPIPTSGELTNNHIELRTNEVITANAVVAAYVDSHNEVFGENPPARSIGRLAKEAKLLLDEGKQPELVIEAAKHSALNGHANIASSYTWLLAQDTRNSQQKQSAVTKALNWTSQMQWDDEVKEIEQ